MAGGASLGVDYEWHPFPTLRAQDIRSLVPDGVFVPREGGVCFEALPPPTQGEVERLLRVVRHRVLRLLEKRGALPAQGPEDARQAYQAHSLQQRLRWTEVDVRPPPRKQPRCAVLEGFSLHANTHLHANDRLGLERLCRYGARGALALERLSRAEDGRIAYRMKRPLPDGTTHLLFTGLELLRRVASLVPPPRANLTRFHGVLAPGAKLRPFLVPQAAGAGERSVALEAAARKEPKKERTPRVDQAELLRKTFDFDVFACVRCGGRRRVLAYVNEAGGVRAILEHLGLATAGARLAPARGPPRPRGVEAQAAPAKRANPLPRTSWEGSLGRRVSQGAARLLHLPGSLLGRPPVSRPPRLLRSSPHPLHGLYPAYTCSPRTGFSRARASDSTSSTSPRTARCLPSSPSPSQHGSGLHGPARSEAGPAGGSDWMRR